MNTKTTTSLATMSDKPVQKPIHKRWLYVSLAAALMLGACADDSAVNENETAVDAQASVEQGATGVASADTPNDPMTDNSMASDNVAVASDDMASETNTDMMNDDVAVAEANDGTADGVDDSEILDGTESEEHVSTY